MTRVLAAAGAALVLSLTACSSGGTVPDSTPPATRPPFRTTTPGPIETAPSGTATPVPAARWDAIVADLADRGVSDEPQLVSAEAVTFANGALGCPKPGVAYTQQVVEGMRVVVRAGGASYDYRFGRGDKPVLCER
ncbi:MAG: hypothetical protein QM611_09265 [Microbacterium sp.]|uniref:hypothetical protein n=1 Tax=Microbacterium sp. TaxID=51671 RepID=UPI0039E5A23E